MADEFAAALRVAATMDEATLRAAVANLAVDDQWWQEHGPLIIEKARGAAREDHDDGNE